MIRTIDVVFRHQDAEPADFGSALVIDTLRATTTMTTILERGAMAVRPVASLEEAYQWQSRDPHVLLGGERDNRPPEGFDGGNSPFDWPAARVRGQRVVFTTTNGTAAIERVRSVPHLGLAALINAEAAARFLWQWECPALVVASGTRGRIALEDVLAAGAVASQWPRDARSDAAEIAAALYWQHREQLGDAVRYASHGRDLAAMHRDQDLEYAAAFNRTRVVPVLCQDGWLRASE